jgi:hypothetical protein
MRSKINMTSAGRFSALLLILSAPLASQAQTPVIYDIGVNLPSGWIAVNGSNFSPTGVSPKVAVAGALRTLYSFTNLQVVVEVPSTLPANTYTVTVTNSVPLTVSAYMTVGAAGPTGPQGPAGLVTLPFSGSGSGTSSALFNITNTTPQHSAIAGNGAQALSGAHTGGTGVGAYGGASNGNSSEVGTGGAGVYALGGAGTAEGDNGGAGLRAYGGNAAGGACQVCATGGAGVTANGGNVGDGTGGDGIDAYGGTSQGVFGGDGIYAKGSGNTDEGYGYAGNFAGDVNVSGNLIKSSGSFKIDHPLDPANKYLYHSFVESPDMMNIYNGNVVTDGSGTAIVTMPAWFEALNTDFRYQLTVIGQFAQAIVATKMTNGSFTIKTSKPGVEVSWQVTGIRQDAWANAHRIQVEVDKAQRDQGHYIHPELFGHEGEPSIAQMHHPRSPATAQK